MSFTEIIIGIICGAVNTTILVYLLTAINSKASHKDVEDIVNNKISLLTKDISTIKNFLADLYKEITGKTPSYFQDK